MGMPDVQVCMVGFEMERLDTLNTSTHLPTTEEVGDYVSLSMQLFREKHERAHSHFDPHFIRTR